MPSISSLFLLYLVEPGPSVTCLSVMIYLSPSFEKYWGDLWLIMYSLKSPIRRIRYPSFFHLSNSSFIQLRKPCLEQIILFVLLKEVRCYEQTETGPPPWAGVTGLQNVAILSEVFPFPLNFCQIHIRRPERSFPDAIFPLLRFTVESNAISPYWNGTRKGSCLLQGVFESSCWLIKWPLNL